MNNGSQRPTEETIVPQLLDAVESLCATENPDNVGMRQIAAEASLSVGVAYRYFESKNALIGAALDRMAERLADAATGATNPDEAIDALWTALNANPAFPRLVTWTIMNGINVSELMSKHPVVRDVAAAAANRGHQDPQTAGGVTALVAIAAAVYGPTVNRAMQRDADDQRLYDSTSDMLTDWIGKSEPESS
jgi:AcrR family transcriptional regulator